MAKKTDDIAVPPKRQFAKIAKVIRHKGRVAGFEALRDMALCDWELLSARMNPYSALKFALEADRHAMFAEIAQAKTKDTFNHDMWTKFQDYLKGNVDMAPDPMGPAEDAPAPSSVAAPTMEPGIFSHIGPPAEEDDNGEEA